MADTQKPNQGHKKKKSRGFSEGLNPVGVEREAKRKEIRTFLDKNHNDRPLTIKWFRNQGLSVAFIRKAIGSRGLPKDQEEISSQRKGLEKKVQKFLLTQTGGVSAVTEKAFQQTYIEFAKQGFKKKHIRTAIFKVIQRIKKLDQEEGSGLMKIFVRSSKKTGNLSAQHKDSNAGPAKKINPKEKKELLKRNVLKETAQVKLDIKQGQTDTKPQPVKKQERNEKEDESPAKKVKLETSSTLSSRGIIGNQAAKTPVVQPRHVSFSDGTQENSNKSLRKTPPTPKPKGDIKAKDKKKFQFDEEDSSEESESVEEIRNEDDEHESNDESEEEQLMAEKKQVSTAKTIKEMTPVKGKKETEDNDDNDLKKNLRDSPAKKINGQIPQTPVDANEEADDSEFSDEECVPGTNKGQTNGHHSIVEIGSSEDDNEDDVKEATAKKTQVTEEFAEKLISDTTIVIEDSQDEDEEEVIKKASPKTAVASPTKAVKETATPANRASFSKTTNEEVPKSSPPKPSPAKRDVSSTPSQDMSVTSSCVKSPVVANANSPAKHNAEPPMEDKENKAGSDDSSSESPGTHDTSISSLPSDFADDDPFEKVLKEASLGGKKTPSKNETSSKTKTILRKSGATSSQSSTDDKPEGSKRVSWGKNEYAEPQDLMKFTPQSTKKAAYKKKQSICLMSFDTPVQERKGNKNDEGSSQSVSKGQRKSQEKQGRKKASPKLPRISPRMTRSARKKQEAGQSQKQ